MAKSIKFKSLETYLVVAMFLLAILPTAIVGWMAHNLLFEHIRSERIADVGQVANAKHTQLVMVLTRANDRAKLFLADLGAQCNGGATKLNRACAARLIRSYLSAENALRATLHGKGSSNSLDIGGTPAFQNAEGTSFQAGQLAKLSGAGPANNRSYFISVVDSTGLQLEITYPSSNLQPVFDRPTDLGDSGETFLADGEGYFITQARYPSTHGHNHPVSARPMRSCLGCVVPLCDGAGRFREID